MTTWISPLDIITVDSSASRTYPTPVNDSASQMPRALSTAGESRRIGTVRARHPRSAV